MLNIRVKKVNVVFRDGGKPLILDMVNKVAFDPNLRVMLLETADGNKTYVNLDATRHFEVEGGIIVS